MSNTTSRLADWDQLRYFLAVAETGSLSAASQVLGVSHPTVRRQIRDLESWLVAKLFNRTPDGYVLTETGARLVDLAKAMKITANAIERCASGDQSECAGRVSIAAAEGIGTAWLAAKIAEFRQIYGDIEIQLNISSGQLDLMRLEADIALRLGDPGDQDLVGRRIGKVDCGLYAAKRYLDENGTPSSVEDLQRHAIIESTGEVEGLEQVKRFREVTENTVTAMSCNNLLTQFAAMQAGVGVLAVPVYMTRDASNVIRVLPDEFNVELDLWLLTHPDLTRAERVRATIDFLTRSIRSDPSFGGCVKNTLD